MKSKLFLHAENRVLGRFRDAELHDFLGLDLDCLASRRITADARLAIDQDELAEAGDGVARVTVPRRGSVSAARDFVAGNIGWLE